MTGESHGLRVFLLRVTSFTPTDLMRGCEGLTNAYSLLDLTRTGGRRTLRTRLLAGHRNRHTARRFAMTGSKNPPAVHQEMIGLFEQPFNL